MFLRATKRFKDGKVHYYWSMVENVRVGRRVFRIARGEAEPPKAVARGVRQALYLGELNDSQREEWQRAIEAFDEKGNVRQLKLFPEDRAPETDDGQVVRIRIASNPSSSPTTATSCHSTGFQSRGFCTISPLMPCNKTFLRALFGDGFVSSGPSASRSTSHPCHSRNA